MTQAFNPFAQPSTPAAAQPAFAAPAAPLPVTFPNAAGSTTVVVPGPSRGGLDDASNDGPGSPLMPHVDGNFKFRVVGYTTFVGHKSGPAVHISCLALESSNPAVQVGGTYRFIYKYDFANDRPAQGNVGLVHLRLLRQFWQAASKNPAASVLQLHKQALGLDWATTDVRVNAQATLVPYSKLVNGQVTTEPRRNETWLPAQ